MNVHPTHKGEDPLPGTRLALLDAAGGLVTAAVTTAASVLGVARPLAISSARRALLLFESGYRPDILLVNWIPPDRSPLDFCKALRSPSTSPCPFLPIVIIAPAVTRQNVLEARDAGVDEFLTVPFSPKTFRHHLLAALLQRRGFVDVPGYFGPDRRRGAMAEFLGVNRRDGGALLIDPRTGQYMLD